MLSIIQKMPYFICTVLLTLTVSAAAHAATQVSSTKDFILEEIAEGLGVPWAIAFLSDSELLITQRSGGVVILDITSGEQRPVKGVAEVKAKGQGGLLDVVLSPNFATDSQVYFTYSRAKGGDLVTVLARARLVSGALSDWQELLVTESATDSGRHFGSRIVFVNEQLFMTVGDRGHRPNGQDLQTHAGAILRLDLDGRAAEGNPFVGNSRALPEIWSYGHRNPQGIAWDANKKMLWAIEHGPRGGDELNLILPGENYGWAKLSHGKEYWGPISVGEAEEMEGYAAAKKIYTPSIAPSSLLHYSGSAFPQWQGSLFAGALKILHLNRLVIDVNGDVIQEQRLLEDLKERIRALAQSPEGYIYFSTDSGRIYRLRPHDKG